MIVMFSSRCSLPTTRGICREDIDRWIKCYYGIHVVKEIRDVKETLEIHNREILKIIILTKMNKFKNKGISERKCNFYPF